MSPKDYYYILGVKKSASINEIKDAFKKLSLKFHPDLNKETDSNFWAERFIEIREAYEVLSDEYKRMQYDENLEQPLNPSNKKNDSYSEALFLKDLDKEIENYLNKKAIAKQYVEDLNNIYPATKKMTMQKWTISILLLLIFGYLFANSTFNLNSLKFTDKSIQILNDNPEAGIYSEPDVKSERKALFKEINSISFVGQTNYFYMVKYNDSINGFVRKKEVKYDDELPFVELNKISVQNNDDNALIPPISEPDVVQDVNNPFEYEEGSEIGIAVDSMRESGATVEEVKQYLMEEYKKSKSSL